MSDETAETKPSNEDMPAYDRVRQKLKKCIDTPIDDMSLEELLVFRQLAIEIEQTVKEGRKKAGIQLEWLVWGKKDKRRTKFQYWRDWCNEQ